MNLRLPILAPLKLVSKMALASAHGSDTGVITNVNTANNILVTASAKHGTRQSITTTAITGPTRLHLVKARTVPKRCTSQLWPTFLNVLTLLAIATHYTSSSQQILSPTGIPSSPLPMQKLQMLPITARTIGSHITHSLHPNRMYIHEIPRRKTFL